MMTKDKRQQYIGSNKKNKIIPIKFISKQQKTIRHYEGTYSTVSLDADIVVVVEIISHPKKMLPSAVGAGTAEGKYLVGLVNSTSSLGIDRHGRLQNFSNNH
jgi:hypothetical protein